MLPKKPLLFVQQWIKIGRLRAYHFGHPTKKWLPFASWDSLSHSVTHLTQRESKGETCPDSAAWT